MRTKKVVATLRSQEDSWWKSHSHIFDERQHLILLFVRYPSIVFHLHKFLVSTTLWSVFLFSRQLFSWKIFFCLSRNFSLPLSIYHSVGARVNDESSQYSSFIIYCFIENLLSFISDILLMFLLMFHHRGFYLFFIFSLAKENYWLNLRLRDETRNCKKRGK